MATHRLPEPMSILVILLVALLIYARIVGSERLTG